MKKTAAFIASGTKMGADTAKHLVLKGFNIAIMSSSRKGESLANSLGVYGKVSRVSAIVDLLASRCSPYITSQNIRVDSGITRSVLITFNAKK